jgi:hypothetical protein
MMRTLTRALIAIGVIAAIAVNVLAHRRSYSATPAGPRRAGAVRAAVAALYALSVPAITSPERFETEVVRLSAPGAEQEVHASFGATPSAVRAAFSREPRVLRGAPLGYRIERFANGSASVAIWSVAIAASDGFGSESQWRTLTVDLEWTARGWKVTGGKGATGPEPATPLRRLARESATFRSFVHVP